MPHSWHGTWHAPTGTKHSLNPFSWSCCSLSPTKTTQVCVKTVFKVKQYIQPYGSPNTRLCAVTIEMFLYFIFRRYSFLKAFPRGVYHWLVLTAGLLLFILLNSTACIQHHPLLFPPSWSSCSWIFFFSFHSLSALVHSLLTLWSLNLCPQIYLHCH